MRAIRWEIEARLQFKDILTYIADRNIAAAKRLESDTLRKLDLLGAFPEMGRLGRVAGTRELIVHANYLVIYVVRSDTIDVLRILHARQQYPPPKS